MVTVSECRPLSLQIVGNSDSQPKLGSIWAEDTIYIFVSTLIFCIQYFHVHETQVGLCVTDETLMMYQTIYM